MNKNDKNAFYNALTGLHELYGKTNPTKLYASMYFNALSHISLDDFMAGANLHTRDTDQGQFMPKPADILRNIQGNKETQAESAWSEVDHQIRVTGDNQTMVFDDPLIHAVISDMGGWITLCRTGGKEYPFKHNEFVKRYRGFVNKAPERTPKKLIGVAEMHNSAEGHIRFIPRPVFVGDVDKCLKILNNNLLESDQDE